MRTATLIIATTIGTLALAGSAGAAGKVYPPGWVKIETAGFTMALPKDWIEFVMPRKFNVVKEPAFGAYGFMSPNAGSKVYVRYNKVKPEPIEVTIKRGIGHLEKKSFQLKKLNEIQIPKDERGRHGVVQFFQGYAPAVKKTGKEKGSVQDYLHVIIRGHLRMPALKAQVSVTHMYRGDKVLDPKAIEAQQKFFFDHVSTFEFKDPAVVARQIKVKVEKEPKPVNLAKNEVVGGPAKPAPKKAPPKK